ncbi:MAG: hypothetical protein E6I72_00900 [Chloroflexi bacterium]|nr:MAG: hypothetical protein E6I72_00900 [Chloroflexota bacterium]
MVPPPPGAPQPYGMGAPYALPEAQGALPAMVLGIVGLVLLPLSCCCGVGALPSVVLGILGIVFGVSARNRINASGGTLGGSSRAMAGIICGGIAVGVAAILFILVLAVGLGSGAFLNAINNAIATPTP